MIPLLLTALLLALAHCCEPLLEPMEELESIDMNMGYENEVMQETDLDQKEGQSVVVERQFISATAVYRSVKNWVVNASLSVRCKIVTTPQQILTSAVPVNVDVV
ncbi:hypothetical protein Pmani_007414 [Petrolisthes manimaculis]|uniref:Uncharacterized protein n=1 Tax=Petrolisthes manimaculis TaxID=1843537 RepID=A0AAE1QAN5_9EUCA|nr:hypothetical protein Pmani_007414 [Petrolisthes manimaculis]